jgi:hypothetical protein
MEELADWVSSEGHFPVYKRRLLAVSSHGGRRRGTIRVSL